MKMLIMAVLKRNNEINNMITLPKASYIIIDPCYVMPEDLYSQLCNALDFDETNQKITINDRELAVLFTTHGDGYYRSNIKSDTLFGVDSGSIACGPLELCSAEMINSLDPNTFYMVNDYVECVYSNGTLCFNDVEIYTDSDRDDNDDGYYEDDYHNQDSFF